MTWIRKAAMVLLLIGAVAAVTIAVSELWNYRQGETAAHLAAVPTLDERARLLEVRVEGLTRRVGDMQLLVLVLLGASGLYAVVFVITSYLSAMNFARQADRAIHHIKDEIGVALGDLREFQEETQAQLEAQFEAFHEPAPAPPPPRPKPVRVDLRGIARSEAAAPVTQPVTAASPQEQVAHLFRRLKSDDMHRMDKRARLALLDCEHAAARLEIAHGKGLEWSLAGVYGEISKLYAPVDDQRSRFYFANALRLAPAGSPLASDLHYDLACRLAAARDFPQAIAELSAAFEHQSKSLDERLATDIDEGGQLYELASTEPFDKALNDLLLNVNVP